MIPTYLQVYLIMGELAKNIYQLSTSPPSPDNTRDHHRRTGNYAAQTGIVTAVIEQVPNQPVVFTVSIVRMFYRQILLLLDVFMFWIFSHKLQ